MEQEQVEFQQDQVEFQQEQEDFQQEQEQEDFQQEQEQHQEHLRFPPVVLKYLPFPTVPAVVQFKPFSTVVVAVTSAPAGKGALESVTKAKSATIVSSVPVTQDQILKKQIGDAGPAKADVTSDGLTVTAVPAGKIYGVTGTQLLMGMGAAGLLGYNVLHHKSKTKNTAK